MRTAIIAAAFLALALAAWASSRKRTPSLTPPAPISAEEHARTIAAMKPPKRARPVIAVIGQNAGTETTDYVIPYSVLTESRVADVFALGTDEGTMRLTPALSIRPHMSTAAFDARYPDGADYVVVPKIEDAGDPAVVSWIQAQSAGGATIVGICAGALTLSAAGMLADRSATGHWYDRERLQKENPTMRWVRDRRYVADRGVVTTTGVSASLPVSLALVEAIAGSERAAVVAAELGADHWDERHDSAEFWLDPASKRTAMINRYAFWRRETYLVPVADGVDELSLAFTADAWSRTFRSQALAISKRSGSLETRRGLELLPDGEKPGATMLPPVASREVASSLPAALAAIAKRYGEATAWFVALQLEYSWRPEK